MIDDTNQMTIKMLNAILDTIKMKDNKIYNIYMGQITDEENINWKKGSHIYILSEKETKPNLYFEILIDIQNTLKNKNDTIYYITQEYEDGTKEKTLMIDNQKELMKRMKNMTQKYAMQIRIVAYIKNRRQNKTREETTETATENIDINMDIMAKALANFNMI